VDHDVEGSTPFAHPLMKPITLEFLRVVLFCK
jgi:hypothetical protein